MSVNMSVITELNKMLDSRIKNLERLSEEQKEVSHQLDMLKKHVDEQSKFVDDLRKLIDKQKENK